MRLLLKSKMNYVFKYCNYNNSIMERAHKETYLYPSPSLILEGNPLKVTWKGIVGLVVILIGISIVAYLLSSLEGFVAGVLAVFIGFLVSFFRSDIKRYLGLQKEKELPKIEVETEDKEGQEDLKIIRKLEKKIGKQRQKLAKEVVEYNPALPEKKRRKVDQDIVEEATELIGLLDSAKGRAIQLGEPELVSHYDEILGEIKETREKSMRRLSG